MQTGTFIDTDKEATHLNSKSSNAYFIFDTLHVYLYVCKVMAFVLVIFVRIIIYYKCINIHSPVTRFTSIFTNSFIIEKERRRR